VCVWIPPNTSPTDYAMWCGHCHQDVPVLDDRPGQPRYCLRCGTQLRSNASTPAGRDDRAEVVATSASTKIWEMRDRLDRIERLLAQQLNVTATRPHRAGATPPISAQNVAAIGGSDDRSQSDNERETTSVDTVDHGDDGIGWSIACVALVVLLAVALWNFTPLPSLLTTHQWRAGFVIGSVGLFVVGSIAAAIAVRTATRRAKHVQQQLESLTATAERLHVAAAGRSKLFYRHAAHGASPHILLADLHGQLESLAMQLHNRRC